MALMADHRFVVADDHPLFRGALKQTLERIFGKLSIAEAGTFGEVVETIERDPGIDLVLLDLKMPGTQGFSGLAYLRAQFPQIPVVVVSARDEPRVMRRAIDLGASGFVPKSADSNEMGVALRAVLGGDVWVPEGLDLEAGGDGEADELAQRLSSLTPQQVRVLMMLREGLLNKQIAYQLSVSEATIKAHVSAILQKLGVDSRTQAVIAASRIDGDHFLAG
jgi:DNA-binding NarL/FixJ family response regulator